MLLKNVPSFAAGLLLLALGTYVVLCCLLFYFQERLIFYPERLPAGYRFAFDQPFDEVSFPADDIAISAQSKAEREARKHND